MSERTRTHWEDCWKSSDHHECAVARMKAAERILQAMRNIVHGWENSNYDEQDCLHYLVKALHMEPNNETTED